MVKKVVKAVAGLSFVRFGVVGLLSTIFDMAVYNLFLYLHVSVYIAGALGFFTGFSNGYFMNSRYVFQHASRSTYIKYLLVSLGGLIWTELIIDIGHVRLGMTENGAKLVAVVLVFFWNYLLSKTWVFRSSQTPQEV